MVALACEDQRSESPHGHKVWHRKTRFARAPPLKSKLPCTLTSAISNLPNSPRGSHLLTCVPCQWIHAYSSRFSSRWTQYNVSVVPTYRSLCSPDRQRENVPHPSAYCLRQVECRLRAAPARVVKLVHSPYLYSVCCLFPSLQTIPASYPALLPQWLWFSISQGFHMYNRDVKKPVKEVCRGSQVGMYDCLEGCGRV